MAARRTHGRKRKLCPRSLCAGEAVAKRKRGAQPGNKNNWRHGRQTQDVRAARREIARVLREANALLARLGFEPRRRCWARKQKELQMQ